MRAPAEAAILGKPVGNSLSPVLHLAAYRALGLTDWNYRAIECGEADLPPLLAGSGPAVIGYSCTMPLKRAVLRVAGEVSAQARAIGAGNTLLRRDGGWLADNTDWIGIRDALAERAIPGTATVALLGAGGSAQAALAAVSDAARVTVLVREPARTVELLAAADRLGVSVSVTRLDDHRALRDADLVISTLPPGAADGLAGLGWRSQQALLDAVYHSWPTTLAQSAQQAGATVISGASMLLFQAVGQVQLMTGSAAPVEAMRAALREAAPGCGV